MDKFAGIIIFTEDLDPKMIRSTDMFGTSFSYSTRFSNEENLKKLDLTAQLKINTMANLITLEGSGKFLKIQKNSTRVAMAALFQTIKTKYEDISITNTNFQNLINFDLLDKVNATHVVIGIQWGGKLIVSVEDSNANSQNALQIEGSLGVKLKAWATKVSGKASINFTEQEVKEMTSFQFQLDGDVLMDEMPMTLLGAFEIMKTAVSSLKEGNLGKGKPVMFKLLPLSFLKQIWGKNQQANIISNQIENEIIDYCIKILDTLDYVRQRLNDLRDDYEKNKDYIPFNKLNELGIPSSFDLIIQRVKTDLSVLLVRIRSGESQSIELQQQFETIKRDIIDPYEQRIKDISKIIETHMDFIDFLITKNITILNRKSNFQKFLLNTRGMNIYILFFAEEYTNDNEDKLTQFLGMVEDTKVYKESKFVAIKIDIMNEIKPGHHNGTVSSITLYRDRKVVDEDVDQGQIDIAKYQDIWSPRKMQDALELLLEKVDGNIVV